MKPMSLGSLVGACSIELHVSDRLGQFLALHLSFKHMDGTMGGIVNRSIPASEGVMVVERVGPNCGWVVGKWSGISGEWEEDVGSIE
jgi:hypothetical protein